jgi:phage protein U
MAFRFEISVALVRGIQNQSRSGLVIERIEIGRSAIALRGITMVNGFDLTMGRDRDESANRPAWTLRFLASVFSGIIFV